MAQTHDLAKLEAKMRQIFEAGVPFTLSSDAHVPEQVGYAYGEAVEFMTGLGIDRVCVFSGRERTTEPLG